MIVYSASLVYAASEIGLWHTSALKASIYWLIGTALVLTGDAVTAGARNDRAFLRVVLRRVVAVTVVTEFVVNVYALPFVVEVVCVFVLFLFVGMQAVAQHGSSISKPARTFIDGVIATVGVLYLGYFVIRVVANLDGFVSRKNGEVFLVGPALTIALLPLLLGWARLSRRERRNLRRRFDASAA